MLNNGSFGTVMRSLGMSVKSSGARAASAVNNDDEGRFDGWGHLINLVGLKGGNTWLMLASG